jgi:hypothetical protein
MQYKNNLTDANWIPLGNTIGGNGGVSSISYPNTNGASCFYQLQLQ